MVRGSGRGRFRLGVGEELVAETHARKKHGELLVLDAGGKADFRRGDDLPGPELQVAAFRVEHVVVVKGLGIDRDEERRFAAGLGHDGHFPEIPGQGSGSHGLFLEIPSLLGGGVGFIQLLAKLHVLSGL